MARRRGPRPSVQTMNKFLIAGGFKKQGRPLGTRRIDQEPSIPQMHPKIINPSRWRRVGRLFYDTVVSKKIYRVRPISKKRGGGFGGGKSPVKRAKPKGHAAKLGGTRGAKPGREPKKKKKTS